MNYRLLFLSLSLVASSSSILAIDQSNVFKTIIPENIALAEQSIKKELFWDKIYRVSTFSAVGVGVGFALYKLLNPSVTAAAPVATAMIVPTASLAQGSQLSFTPEAIKKFEMFLADGGTIDELMRFIAVRNLKKEIKLNQSYVGWFSEWFQLSLKSTAQQLVIAMLLTGLNLNSIFGPFAKYVQKIDQSIDKGLTYLFHSNTLAWYIGSHADLVFVFNKMEETCAAFEGKQSLIPANPLVDNNPMLITCSPNSPETLMTFWDLYIQQITMILGFMQFKINQCTQQALKPALIASQDKILQLTNKFAGHLQDQIITHDPQSSNCFTPLKELRAQIGNELSNFSYMESFKRNDFLIEQKIVAVA